MALLINERVNMILRFSAPTVINLEITDFCTLRCRHCYNYWRQENQKSISMTKEMIDQLLDMFVSAGIFHVVFTGGEPFVRFDILEYGIKQMVKNDISVSCNSNLLLANEDKIKRLVDAGLDHILTSLNSCNPEINDYMANHKGAFSKIVRGIEAAVKHGLRISVNMIISQQNKDHVYETGRLCHNLGCQKLFGTRMVPPVNVKNAEKTEFQINKADALQVLEQLVKLKKDTGIMIGTLVSYPLCLLGDLEKYADFVGRGCPAQSGHTLSINANGQTHACVHEEDSYGNIFDIGIFETYRKMHEWHTASYRYAGCNGCVYIEICKTGCRMSAHSYCGALNGRDQLMQDKDSFVKHYKIVYDNDFYKKIEGGARFFVPKRLRFRKENNFYLLNIRWANTIIVSNEVAEFLIRQRASNAEFNINDFGSERKELFATLFFKDAIESNQIKYSDFKNKVGLSADPFLLTQGS